MGSVENPHDSSSGSGSALNTPSTHAFLSTHSNSGGGEQDAAASGISDTTTSSSIQANNLDNKLSEVALTATSPLHNDAAVGR